MLTGHTSSLVALWRGHLCRTFSVVWSSWPQGQAGEDAIFSLPCIWLFSLLCPVRSLTRTTCSSQDSRWWSSLCDLRIVDSMRVFFSLKLTLLACCSPLAPSFARMFACSFPDIPQWAGIHYKTALLVAATCCRALARFGSLWFWYACRYTFHLIRIFFFFFFFAFPSYISGVHRFWVRFLRMWPFFNPTIKVVTFHLSGWCVLGVFLLPAFTRLGHERQDLLSPCDEMHVCTD